LRFRISTVAKTSESTATAKTSAVVINTLAALLESSLLLFEEEGENGVPLDATASLEILISQCGPSQPFSQKQPGWLNRTEKDRKDWCENQIIRSVSHTSSARHELLTLDPM
jgi:hypothetical protein